MIGSMSATHADDADDKPKVVLHITLKKIDYD